MSKREKVTLQCADCGCKFVRTYDWLEYAHYVHCGRCQVDLDVDEVVNEILIANELDREEVYLVYQR